MLSEIVKLTRMYSGITQQKMATILNISVPQYNRKENGTAEIDRDELKKIAKVLDLDEDTLNIYWMADKFHALMKTDRELAKKALDFVELHYDEYETFIPLPSKSCSYSNLEERMKYRKNKKN
ncbi:MAG: helix-turn-helix transcriptional regulator [Bacteroidales bacterium]|nr:helix-turn-helix transcriptional regulator [Bacteroidales bacterium]